MSLRHMQYILLSEDTSVEDMKQKTISCRIQYKIKDNVKRVKNIKDVPKFGTLYIDTDMMDEQMQKELLKAAKKSHIEVRTYQTMNDTMIKAMIKRIK